MDQTGILIRIENYRQDFILQSCRPVVPFDCKWMFVFWDIVVILDSVCKCEPMSCFRSSSQVTHFHSECLVIFQLSARHNLVSPCSAPLPLFTCFKIQVVGLWLLLLLLLCNTFVTLLHPVASILFCWVDCHCRINVTRFHFSKCSNHGNWQCLPFPAKYYKRYVVI